MKTPTAKQVRRAAKGNERTVPHKFRPRRQAQSTWPRERAVTLGARIRDAVTNRLKLGLGRAGRIERKARKP